MIKSNLTKFIFVVLIINLFALTSYSQSNLTYDGKKLFQIVEQKQNSSEQIQGESKTPANTISTFELNKNNCEYLFKYSGEILRIENFPINSIENGTVNLRRVKSAVDADTKWWRQTKSGLVAGAAPEIFSYTGTIGNSTESKIFLNYCSGNLFAYIRSTDGYQYDMVSIINDNKPNSTKIVIAEQNYKIKNLKDVNPFECLTDDIIPESTEQEDLFKMGNELQKDATKLYEVRIGIDAINNLYKLLGSDYNKTVNYIAAIMSHVSFIYEENFNVRLYVPYVLVREITEEDPYVIYEFNDFEQKLTNMEWIWDGGFNDRPENVALIFMLASLYDRPNGTMVAGLSYSGYPSKGVLCDRKYGFGIAGITGSSGYPDFNSNYNYTWDVNVVAHELGHNFGLPHTHNCYYEPNMIDTCVTQTSPTPVGDACLTGKNIPRPGTLMSYCHIANSTGSVQLKFHERERPLVRKAVQRAECFTEMKIPYIKILSPLVKNLYVAEDTILIRWTTVKINKVNLFYSVNDGANWVNIASSIPANDSTYIWTAPAIETDKMIFKIEDSENSSTLDISNSRVRIIIPKIAFITPSKKKEYSNREKMKFSWEANVSKKFNGYFSSDNGINWNKLFDNTGITEFSFELPDLNSESCILKVVDAVKNGIIALSPAFAIGDAYLDLSGPREGEILCAGRKYTIRWTSKYLNSFLIEYSVNNGADWKKSGLNAIEIDKNEYDWNIPDLTSDSVLVRAIIYDDRDQVIFTADHFFAIDTCAASIQENVSSKVLIEITAAKPNPMNNFVEFKIINNSDSQNAELSLINISGATVWKDRERKLFTGENIVHCDFSTIPQGEYYLILKNSNCNLSYPISIVR